MQVICYVGTLKETSQLGHKVQGSCTGLQDVPSRSTSTQRLPDIKMDMGFYTDFRQETACEGG